MTPSRRRRGTFIFKLQVVGGRGGGGGVPAQRASLVLGFPEAPQSRPTSPQRGSRLTWRCAGTRLRMWAALHGCSVTRVSWGVSAAAAAAAGGQDGGPAAHHAQPAQAATVGVGGAPGKVEAGSAGACEAQSRRPPRV